jgi:hypothetical protein
MCFRECSNKVYNYNLMALPFSKYFAPAVTELNQVHNTLITWLGDLLGRAGRIEDAYNVRVKLSCT